MPIEVRRIKHGDVITEPGFYEMPIEWHHSQCCDGFSVSSTGLRLIDLKSPLHFFDKFVNIDAAADDDETAVAEAKHFRMGRAAHTLMLEPEKFAGLFTTRPAMWNDWRTNAAKAWRDDAIREGYTVMSADEMADVHGIATALKGHRWHSEGILSGVVECTMVVRDKKTGIYLKSRPDAVPLERVITDLKVLRSALPRDVANAVRSHGYDMQMALAGVCLTALTDQPVENYWLVAIEPKRPYAMHVATLSSDGIYWARVRLRKALDVLAECLKSNYWPTYGEDGAAIGPTNWDAERYKEQQKSGLLPIADTF